MCKHMYIPKYNMASLCNTICIYAFRAEENHIQPKYRAVEPSPKGYIYKNLLYLKLDL